MQKDIECQNMAMNMEQLQEMAEHYEQLQLEANEANN